MTLAQKRDLQRLVREKNAFSAVLLATNVVRQEAVTAFDRRRGEPSRDRTLYALHAARDAIDQLLLAVGEVEPDAASAEGADAGRTLELVEHAQDG